MTNSEEIKNLMEKMDWRGIAKAFAEGNLDWHAEEWKNFIEQIKANAYAEATKDWAERKKEAQQQERQAIVKELGDILIRVERTDFDTFWQAVAKLRVSYIEKL